MITTIEKRRIPDANFQRLLSLLFGSAQITSTTVGEVK